MARKIMLPPMPVMVEIPEVINAEMPRTAAVSIKNAS